ncbi:MAG: beta-lactamase family protein [Gemmatimonadetes bacterium]|nr:beta-lactamase family protein [Gemmatimonadota bacterium]
MLLPFLALLAALAVPQWLPAQQRHAKLVARIDSLARAALKDGPVPGLALAVVRGRDTIVARGYGYASLEDSVPVSAQTVFPIASITKQFTAAAVMRLVETGGLKLKDSLTRYLPGYPTHGRTITIQQLLNHTAGIRNYTGLGDRWLDRAHLDLVPEEFVAVFRDEPADFPPGEKFGYSNSGYYLLGLVIEKASGEPYGDYVRAHLFSRAGMDASTYCGASGNDRARGYDVRDSAFVPARPVSMTQLYSAGALCSVVLDLVRWQRALAGRKVVNGLSWHLMTEPAELKDGSRASYGFGVMLGRVGKHRMLGHGGSIPGFASQLSHFPDDDLTIVVLANTEHALTRRLADRIAGRVLGIVEPQVKDLGLTSEELDRYVGIYDLNGEPLEVLASGGKLVFRVSEGGPVRLLYQGHHEFAMEADPATRLVFSMSRGRARRVVFAAGDELRLDAERKP